MPLYEYKCLKCHRLTEKIESVNGPYLKKCPHCGGKLEPQISASAIQFKGSGWYVTDYAGKKSVGSSDAGKDEKSSSDKKDSDSKDSAKDSKEAGTKETSAKETKETKDTKEKKSEKPAGKKQN